MHSGSRDHVVVPASSCRRAAPQAAMHYTSGTTRDLDINERRGRGGCDAEDEEGEGRHETERELLFRGIPHGYIFKLASLVLVLSCAATHVQAAGSGMFRFGHISWEAQGNEVSFTIETAFRRSVSKAEWQQAKIGDHLVLFGREAPQFLYGDSQFASTLTMEVTAVSEAEDWVLGVVHLKHTYATPNNNARPWRAQYVGCCRVSDLKNNADLGFEITAEVDLTAASRSPRAATLPVMTVPMVSRPAPGAPEHARAPPRAYIPSRSGSDVHWDVGTPIDVGSAAALRSVDMSYLELPLDALRAGESCEHSSTGAGCFTQMISADPAVGGGAAALTVEGWVKLATRKGGYMVSTSHASASGRNVSTLSIAANESAIVVGHEREELGQAVAKQHAVFPTGHVNLTGLWVHIAVVRMHEAPPSQLVSTQCSSNAHTASSQAIVCSRTSTCVCPLCGGAPGQNTTTYRVYLNGQELSQAKVDTADIQVACGPSCDGASCGSAAGSLLMGAYAGPGGIDGADLEYLDGWLDEWRFWQGVRSQAEIQNFRKVIMNPTREPFSGDPTAGTISANNYRSTAVVLALYSMDYTCPIGVPRPCKITGMLPVYPKGASENGPYKMMGRGKVMTAPPDSQGVMMWQTALDQTVEVDAQGRKIFSPEEARGATHYQVDAAGRFTFAPKQGPGNYQVTILMANSDGSARVPLDFILRVLDTKPAFDEDHQAYELCSGEYDPCAYSGNKYVPRLQILGSVVTNGFCSGNLSRATSVTPFGDLSIFAFPCSLNTWSGFQMVLEARAHDPDHHPGNRVGFVVGAKPLNMTMRLMRSDYYGRLEMKWTPCNADIGSHVVCMAAKDSQQGAASAASEQTCIKLQVLEDPAPYFDVSAHRTRVEPMTLTMGLESTLELYAADDNCLDSLEIGIDHLPPGAALHKKEAHMECTHAHSTMVWTPPYNLGGWAYDMCFYARDSGGSCGGKPHKTQHCVHVSVKRCEYALQRDQQLQELASFYQASWMQLWSLNLNIGHPDIMIYDQQVVMVGHKYRAGPRETAGGVAKRMGMAMRQLALLNYDLRHLLEGGAADVALNKSQELCLIPDSCKGLASTHFSQIKLEDEDSLALHSSDAVSLPAGTAP